MQQSRKSRMSQQMMKMLKLPNLGTAKVTHSGKLNGMCYYRIITLSIRSFCQEVDVAFGPL